MGDRCPGAGAARWQVGSCGWGGGGGARWVGKNSEVRSFGEDPPDEELEDVVIGLCAWSDMWLVHL